MTDEDVNRGSDDGLIEPRLRALLSARPRGETGEGPPAPEAAPPARGRVLRLRMGFNPNSSSVGTTVVVFLWSMIGCASVLAATAGLLAHRLARAAGPDGDDGRGGAGGGGAP